MPILSIIFGLIAIFIALIAVVVWFGKRHEKNINLPVYYKPRYACPFYGFYECDGMYMDQHGNQCPFITGSHSPCRMEMAKEVPDWEKCTTFNTPDNKTMINEIIAACVIFPQEFWPNGAHTWEGISFSKWWDYVMDPDTPRPIDPKLN